MRYAKIYEISSLYYGLDVFCLFEARARDIENIYSTGRIFGSDSYEPTNDLADKFNFEMTLQRFISISFFVTYHLNSEKTTCHAAVSAKKLKSKYGGKFASFQ
jgi:hypothetical protein